MAKSQYDNKVKDNLILIEGWLRDGLTQEDVAKNLGIGKTTWYRYVAEHSELSELLKKGREADYRVENALYKRAVGYKYTEVSEEVNSEGELIKRKTTVKHVVPDVTAQAIWLNNRRPDKWRQKPEARPDGEGGDLESAIMKHWGKDS